MTQPHPHRWLVLFGVWVIYAAFGLIASSLAPLVHRIEFDLGIGHTEMGSIMGAWQLVFIGAAIPCGFLLDRLGMRWALLIGALSIALSAWGRSVADDYVGMLIAVMLFGVGGPIISAGAPKVEPAVQPVEDRDEFGRVEIAKRGADQSGTCQGCENHAKRPEI